MSGRKQHYIPEFLLKKFGRKASKKVTQVTVYSKSRGVFTTSTDNVGAERDFYSGPKASDKTLDDNITKYENILKDNIEKIVCLPDLASPAADLAAEAVTHLCVRQAQLRDAMTWAADEMVNLISEMYLDEDKFRSLLLNNADTRAVVRDELNKIYGKFRKELWARGISRNMFLSLVNAEIERNSNSIFFQALPALNLALRHLRTSAPAVAQQSHRTALGKSLVPRERMRALAALQWVIRDVPPLPLPDCIAVHQSAEGEFSPLAFVGNVEIFRVFVPLSHERLLIGWRTGRVPSIPDNLSAGAASSSWHCFVSRDRSPELEQLVPLVGERTREIVGTSLSEAMPQSAEAELREVRRHETANKPESCLRTHALRAPLTSAPPPRDKAPSLSRSAPPSAARRSPPASGS
jgi:hypothetical protein